MEKLADLDKIDGTGTGGDAPEDSGLCVSAADGAENLGERWRRHYRWRREKNPRLIGSLFEVTAV